ncbi:MAG: phosphatase PAP2 family protein [Defluviitaleaceae bacterium]|nr:phosphatase PAP2 family protein [Defluviitaleaceae bacterium]
MKSNKAIFILLAAVLLFGVLTVFVVMDHTQIAAFNDNVYAPFSQIITPALTTLATLVGRLTHWYSYAPIILLLIIIPRTRLKAGLPMAIVLLFSAMLGPVLLKNIFAVERPMVNQLVNIGGFGYPSGHSLNAMVFFGMSAILVRRYATKPWLKNAFTAFAIVAILLVGLSRIYLGVHTATDVIGGFLAGAAVLGGMVLLERHLTNPKIIKIVLISAASATVLIHLVHAFTLDRMVVYNEITFASANLPAHMDGYRIAFVTDTHSETGRRVRGIVDELNHRNIDLLLLGGDFTFDKNELTHVLDLLSQVNAPDGIFGVEGNHDKYEILFPAMEERGMVPLSNSGQYVRDGFFLAATEDLWNRDPDVQAAIAGAGPGSFVLLLAHNPDTTMERDTNGVDLVLSGHTHGGQMNLFGAISIGLDTRIISEYGDRFKGGWAESADGVPVYVSRGIGDYYPRIFARPEVTIITLTRP